MILCIKHIDIEGPGTLGDYLRERDFHVHEINLAAGDHLPSDLSNLDAVISLGGPMNVYEEQKYPFLAEEDVFLKDVIKEGIPLLGICLGAQLVAKASGAAIRKSPVKEVGFTEVLLTDEGSRDALFRGLSKTLNVFQWHEDTFDLPPGACLLAAGPDCYQQAFRVGRAAYGIQFHLEVTHVDIGLWARAYCRLPDEELARKRERLLLEYFDHESRLREESLKLYANLTGLIHARHAV